MYPKRLVVTALAVAALLSASPEASGGRDLVRGVSQRAPRVGCASCLVVDEDLDALWARDPARPRANASTTKMVTALIAVERADAEETITVSSEAAAVGGGGLDLQAGESFSVHDLLVALLLSSSNEAAVALAEHVAGSEEAFVEEMNALAR